MPQKLLILGSQQHAKVLSAIAQECYAESFQVVGHLDDNPNRLGEDILGFPVLASFSELPKILAQQNIKQVGLGVSNRFMIERATLFKLLQSLDCQVPSLIHTHAYISPFAKIGKGVLVNPGVVVNAHATIGNNVVIYSNTTIEHETILMDNTYIGPGVNFSSNARVGKNTFIGAGAKIIPNIHIGEHVVVGAGSIVLKDIPDGVTIAGVPARIIGSSENTYF